MQPIPRFPHFRPIELDDRPFIREVLIKYGPGTSELTFTNLFIWRNHYSFQWSVYKDWLCITGVEGEGPHFAMEPVGPATRADVAVLLLEWLSDEKGVLFPSIERADSRLVSELAGKPQMAAQLAREHFDYVYVTKDLIDLAGNRYRAKRNHINQFNRSYGSYLYEPLGEDHLNACRALQERWCMLHRCEEDLNLSGEWDAVKEILNNYDRLELVGAVILLDGDVEAFTIGELLSDDMAVIHIEKADPGIPGLYQLINQQFCARQWHGARFVNREQDLGIAGLREAKLSYNPHHLVEKYRITRKPAL